MRKRKQPSMPLVSQGLLADEQSAKYIGDKKVVKVIVVPKKIVNIVIK